MNDFFTELDSDLRDGRIAHTSPQKPAEKVERRPPVTRNIRPEPAAPTHKRQGPKEKVRDGHRAAPASGHIVEVRAQMMQSWVVVIVFKADEKTKTLLGHLKLETRGFAHLDEVRELHKAVIKRAHASYEDTVQDVPDIEEKDLIKIIRHDLEIFLAQRLGRDPVVVPIIVYV